MSEQHLDSARAALEAGDLDSALAELIRGTETLLDPSSPVYRMPIGWRAADEICATIGGRLTGDGEDPAGGGEDLDLYIATQIYAGGGHTAVIGDFVRAAGSARSEVLLTGTVDRDVHAKHGGVPPDEVVERLGVDREALAVCPETTPAAAATWLAREIRERRPRRVFLFHHPQDAVAIAGAATTRGELYLAHHADRQPCLGLYLENGTIVDLSPFTGEFTRRVLGLETRYAPLIISDPGPPPERDVSPPFTTVSSGAEHKFDASYAANIARVLAATGGKHIHIGFLKKKRLEKIRGTLSDAGIDLDRFEYVRWVPSLAQALTELRADLCIGSAPLGGARTAIECCAAGVPMLGHHPDFSTRFGVNHITPKSWPIWEDIDELLSQIAGIDAAWITDFGMIGRHYYENQHHPDRLRVALADLEGAHLPERLDLPLSELLDLPALDSQLVGPLAFLRREFGRALA